MPVGQAGLLRAILSADAGRLRILSLVRSLELPDCWVAAGFVRSAAWDFLHGRPPGRHFDDVDVVWFDPASADPAEDLRWEARLRRQDGSIAWSVKNQARMHLRNGDAPYASAVDAMRHWPETATAVAARADGAGGLEIAAPYGLADLFDLVVRPTPPFMGEKRPVFRDRVRTKEWLRIWPRLRLADIACDVS